MAMEKLDLTGSVPASLTKVREVIRELNRIDLARADYSYLVKQIGTLMEGIPVQAFSPQLGTTLYRGISYPDKPMETARLGPPPVQVVKGYQRCNAPGKPMFYASIDLNAIFAELNIEVGRTLYLSTWTVMDEFYFFRIPPRTTEVFQASPAYSMTETFFETRFAQPIHEDFSEQYKITAAIAEQLAGKSVVTSVGDRWSRELGGVTYPSVAHKDRAENIAIRPEVAATCLKLQNVTEVYVFARDENSWSVEARDFSTTFNNGAIVWNNRPPRWATSLDASARVSIENNQWIARMPDGTIINSL